MAVAETKALIALVQQVGSAGMTLLGLPESESPSHVTYRLYDLVLSTRVPQRRPKMEQAVHADRKNKFYEETVAKCQFLGQRCENSSNVLLNKAAQTAKVLWSL